MGGPLAHSAHIKILETSNMKFQVPKEGTNVLLIYGQVHLLFSLHFRSLRYLDSKGSVKYWYAIFIYLVDHTPISEYVTHRKCTLDPSNMVQNIG